MSSILRGNDSFDTGDYKEHISVPTSYHIYNGTVEATNTIITNGFSSTLYTGNGSTQSINAGVDMTTQWGDNASETFGGLVWIKCRNTATNHFLYDTIRGATKEINSNTAEAEATLAGGLTAINSTGFTVGADAGHNSMTNNMVSWNFQTTHRRTGTTNHGKAYTEHYNPFTGFTIIKYEGSGLAGHEIPHSLGRKLGFVAVKNLSAIANWEVHYDNTSRLVFNLTDASVSDNYKVSLNDSSTTIEGAAGITIDWNTSTNQYIMYSWANSYYDEKNTLIGNYEIGVYQGTGVAGNKVTTKGKPAWLMVKMTSGVGNWCILDNKRNEISGNSDGYVYANLSNAEGSTASTTFYSDGFTIDNGTSDINASGGQYLYMVVYDNDSDSGKSKYPRATDTTNLSINALVPYANGIDAKGSKVSISYKNETISGLTLTQGKNYPYSKNDGTCAVNKYAPVYGALRNRVQAGENHDYFDLNTNRWYSTTGGSELVTNGTFDSNTTGWTATDVNGFTSATISSSSGTLLITNANVAGANGGAYQIISGLTVGETYTVKATHDGTGIIQISPSVLASNRYYYTTATSLTFVAPATSIYLVLYNSTNTANDTINFYNVSMFKTIPTVSTEITPRNYLDCIVYADHNGQVEYVEQLPKIEYKDIIKANKYQGKNACTAWANIDGISTAPLIVDGYNISSVIRVAAGTYRIYFSTPMDNIKFSLGATIINTVVRTAVCFESNDHVRTTGYITVACRVSLSSAYDTLENSNFSIAIFGGKN